MIQQFETDLGQISINQDDLDRLDFDDVLRTQFLDHYEENLLTLKSKKFNGVFAYGDVNGMVFLFEPKLNKKVVLYAESFSKDSAILSDDEVYVYLGQEIASKKHVYFFLGGVEVFQTYADFLDDFDMDENSVTELILTFQRCKILFDCG